MMTDEHIARLRAFLSPDPNCVSKFKVFWGPHEIHRIANFNWRSTNMQLAFHGADFIDLAEVISSEIEVYVIHDDPWIGIPSRPESRPTPDPSDRPPPGKKHRDEPAD